MLPPFFCFNLSSASGIAICAALRAILRFRRQHCRRSSDPDKFTFLLHFKNFSSVFRESLKGKGLFHVQAKTKTYLKGSLSPFCFSSKRYQIPFCNLQ
jgi:hypothetical protein